MSTSDDNRVATLTVLFEGGGEISLSVFNSLIDGMACVQIETNDDAIEGPNGPQLRIMLNDATAVRWSE